MKVNSRYSEVLDKNRKEEVVLLQGLGCFWKKCRFCDYYLDSDEPERVIELNRDVLNNVTGKTGWLTVINSGSYFELPKKTIEEIEDILLKKNIKNLTIEAHYKYKNQVNQYRDYLKSKGIFLHSRIGIETFDQSYREIFLKKGMRSPKISELKESFDECCLLYGLPGQSREQLLKDIKLATDNFSSVYLNIYEERNEFPPDFELIEEFKTEIYPEINDIPNLHILLNNTDLGVG